MVMVPDNDSVPPGMYAWSSVLELVWPVIVDRKQVPVNSY